MRLFFTVCVAALAAAARAWAAEIHVAPNGDDAGSGAPKSPLRTIQRAADLAQPGDVVTVHAGVYRERVNPPRGGASDRERIVYQAAPGERVAIKGSEVVRNWTRVQGDTWRAVLPDSLFGAYNPYRELIHGDWFDDRNRRHHTGAVYLDGEWLMEAARLEDVLDPGGVAPLWFGQVEAGMTTIWARFPGVDPNQALVEINARPTVFYPEKTGVNFITVRGFILTQAATPWAPPTAEQIGLIGVHWSKGWIIEGNVISDSRCAGVTLGKYGDPWDNTSENSAQGYLRTIGRALTNGWDEGHVGSHVVRGNEISHCEQAGICGSLGAAFSVITGNSIHDIYVQRLFGGAEMGGIKLHGAIDCQISGNHIYRSFHGLWLDWMAQGTRVSANVLHDNSSEDLFVELNHGPFLVDNNLLGSRVCVLDVSEGGAYAHNLMTGKIVDHPDKARMSPWLQPHSTQVAGLKHTLGGGQRFYNNIFVGDGTDGLELRQYDPDHAPRGAGFGLCAYDVRREPIDADGNVYYNGARPWAHETNFMADAAFDPEPRLIWAGGRFWLEISLEEGLGRLATRLVGTELLGTANPLGLPYENPDGTKLRIDTDYSGKKRDPAHPVAGPFETTGGGRSRFAIRSPQFPSPPHPAGAAPADPPRPKLTAP